MSRRETNPHFSRPRQPQHEDYQHQPPYPVVPHQELHGQPSPPHGVAPRQQQDLPYHPHPPPLQPQHEDQVPLRPYHDNHFPLQPKHDDHFPLRPKRREHQPPPIPKGPPRREQRGQPHRGGGSRRQHQEDQPYPPPSKQRVNFVEPPIPKPQSSSPVPPPPDIPPEPRQQYHEEPHMQPRHGQRHHHRHRRQDIRLPEPKKSNPVTWCGAVFCVIFWLIIIIGGLVVLIVYLVFRPQSPHFDVSSVTLNAAYLDLGYLLNADVTLLANFTNPNRKVHVDFSSVIIYLYYGSTLIATQYVEPFSAAKVQSRFANIHMVSSHVQLPLRESQRLVKQMESNGVLLQVRGVFRARSKLGSILRYSYDLYGFCNIMLTRPPDGILLKKKCRTKR